MQIYFESEKSCTNTETQKMCIQIVEFGWIQKHSFHTHKAFGRKQNSWVFVRSPSLNEVKTCDLYLRTSCTDYEQHLRWMTLKL